MNILPQSLRGKVMRHWHEQNNILSPCKSTKNCRVTDFDEGKEIVWECGCKEKHGLDEYTHQFAIFDSKWCEEFGANTKAEIEEYWRKQKI